MKILVLVPNNLTNLEYCMKIWEKLSPEIQQKSFCIPMYMQYLVETKQVKDQTEAFFYAMRAAEMVYNSIKLGDTGIIFGNMNKDYRFDTIFNFQNNKYAMYKDYFIEALNEVIKPDGEDDSAYKILSQYTSNLHEANESTLILMDIDAASEFLNKYAATDVEQTLKDLRTQYLEKLDTIKAEGKASMEAKVLNNGGIN